MEPLGDNHQASYRAKLGGSDFKDCIASSKSMIRIFEKAKQIAQFPTTVLLNGETGVGKEVVASFIHRHSDRSDKPYIKINCSAIPNQLLESELFGYESGAFTGAKAKGKAGLFELANNGTILLDEIGDMDIALQAKLLRVLQEEESMRLGGVRPIKLNVRVISSTNRDMTDMVTKGQFSDALFYRLNVVELVIPPLRERRDDIIPLAEFFLQLFCEKYKLGKKLSVAVKECFLMYNWPGNIRELRNIIENVVVSSENAEICLDDLPRRMLVATNSAKPAQTMQQAVESIQKEYIIRALEEYGSIRKAAASLDMDASTFHRLAKKLGIILS
jgi:transcriptional regulator with PAS, ATPase and Fis domain